MDFEGVNKAKLMETGSENKPIYIDAEGKAQEVTSVKFGYGTELTDNKLQVGSSGFFMDYTYDTSTEEASLVIKEPLGNSITLGNRSISITALPDYYGNITERVKIDGWKSQLSLTGSADDNDIFNSADLNENGLNFKGNVGTYLGYAQATYGRSGFEFYPAAYSPENDLWGPTLSYDSATNELKMSSHKDFKYDLPAKITLDNGQTKTILTPDSITVGNITLTADILTKMIDLINNLTYSVEITETNA
jgi:hypothetical protein